MIHMHWYFWFLKPKFENREVVINISEMYSHSIVRRSSCNEYALLVQIASETRLNLFHYRWRQCILGRHRLGNLFFAELVGQRSSCIIKLTGISRKPYSCDIPIKNFLLTLSAHIWKFKYIFFKIKYRKYMNLNKINNFYSSLSLNIWF